MRPPPPPDDELHSAELIRSLRRAMDSEQPVELLDIASMLASIVDGTAEDHGSPFTPHKGTRDTSPSQKIHHAAAMFLDAEVAETDALLRVWAAMLGDELLAQHITSVLKVRSLGVPEWLARIDEMAPRRAVSLQHVLRHEETVFVEVATAAAPFTLAVAVDHSGAPYLEDAYPIGQSMADLLDAVDASPIDHTHATDISLADARGRLEEAIDMADRMHPPIETDTWPSIGKLVSWIVRLLPEGGRGFDLHDWTPEELDDLTDDFMRSSWAADLRPEDRSHALLLFRFQGNYGSNDPLRWGGEFAARVLGDLYPRKVYDKPPQMLRMPVVLRALVQYANERSGVPHDFTVNALAAVDDWEPAYRSAILDAHDDFLGDEGGGFREPSRSLEEAMADWVRYSLEELAEAVGGFPALDSLDLTPLPDEELDTTGIEPDIVARVESLAPQVKAASTDFFEDPEMGTSALRTLTRIAAADPGAFRRRFTDPPTVAALCWIVGKNNGYFAYGSPARVTVRGLMAFLGLKGNPNQRAHSLLTHVLPPDEVRFTSDVALGDPALLTSARRRQIIRIRDDARQRLDALEDGSF